MKLVGGAKMAANALREMHSFAHLDAGGMGLGVSKGSVWPLRRPQLLSPQRETKLVMTPLMGRLNPDPLWSV